MKVIHNHSGQALVEFAMLATLLITLLLGIFDFGRAYYTQVQIKNAVGDAGYYAIQNPGAANYSKVKSTLKSQLGNLQPALNVNTDIAISCTSGTTKIQVTYQYHLIFSWIMPNAQVMLGDETYVPQINACS